MFPLVSESLIHISVYDAKNAAYEPSFILAHHWPMQEYYAEEPVNYMPDFQVYYAMKVGDS